MKIGGIQKISLSDYPGKSCAVLFTISCNMRCGYCHNPELVLPEKYTQEIPIQEVMEFLEKRRNKLEAITISGGEPTMHNDLPEFIETIKNMGYKIKLDSNGTSPDMLADLIEDKLLDFIAMDIKAPIDIYSSITCRPVDPESIKKSINTILSSEVDHEFRTTVIKSQLGFEDFVNIGTLINGADRYALQKFNPGKTLNPILKNEETYSDKEFEELKQLMEKYVKKCVIH